MTAVSGGNNRLAEFSGLDVSGGENAFNAGLAAVGFGYDVAFGIHVNLAFEYIGIGVVPDGDEQAFDGEFFNGIGFNILDFNPGDAERIFGSDDFFDNGIPFNVDFAVVHQTFLHDFIGAETVAAVNEGNAVGKIGEVDSLFNGRVSAADNGNVTSAVEKAVTGGTAGNAETAEFFLGGKPQPTGGGAGSDDNCRRYNRPGRNR